MAPIEEITDESERDIQINIPRRSYKFSREVIPTMGADTP
jgi:hypothetical protein